MIGQAPIGLAPVGGWWQTAGVVVPVFRTPGHRVLELADAIRMSIQHYDRMLTVNRGSRTVSA